MTRQGARFYVVVGVAGSGKTTVGQALASHLKSPFYDGDDFHTPENRARMSNGIPLDDADRAPWLATLAQLIRVKLDKGITGVLACSALKQRYRNELWVDERVQFIYLEGSFDLIWQRMQVRTNHYMKAGMLQSQFEALEPPDDKEAIKIPIDRPVGEVLQLILEAI